MKPASAKQKGRRFQQQIATSICEKFNFNPQDVRSVSMGARGEDILMSSSAEVVFPYSIECKNVERLNIWAAIEQATCNATNGKTPIVAFHKNRSQTYVAMPWQHFLDLTHKVNALTEDAKIQAGPAPWECPDTAAKSSEQTLGS